MIDLEAQGLKIPDGASGQVKVDCPECGYKRSVSVNVDKGLWQCHHAGCEFKGPKGHHKELPTKITPLPRKQVHISERAVSWFNDRGISRHTVEREEIGTEDVYFTVLQEEREAIRFPYLLGGNLVNMKSREYEKNMQMEKGGAVVFWRLDDITPGEPIVITEGEIDTLTCIECGINNALSVPNGATNSKSPKLEYLDGHLCPIEWPEKVILAGDNDAPGITLRDELARRIGRERSWFVDYPEGCKDLNDVLLSYGKDAVRETIDRAYPAPVQGIQKPSAFRDEIMEEYDTPLQRGYSTGWSSVDEFYTVAPGEVTIVTGVPSHGKSEWLDAVMVNLASSFEWRFAIFSPENVPFRLHFQKLAAKLTGKPFRRGPNERMRRDEVGVCLDWLEERVSLIMPDEETFDLDSIVERMRICVHREGVRGIIMDPWNEIDHKRPRNLSETEYISQSLTKIRRFARMTEVHFWLVAHPQKLQRLADGSYPIPTPYDISGCYSEDTEVLTRSGWMRHSKVTLADEIACFDPQTDTFRYCCPSHLWEYDYEGEMYRFSSPSYDAFVTPNHRMLVRPSWASRHEPIGSGMGRPFAYNREGWTFKEAHEIAGDLEMPWSAVFEGGQEPKTILGYPAEGFLQFIGWWVSEGWLNKTSKGLGVCQALGDVATKMARVMSETGIMFTESIGPPGTGGTLPGWKAYIGRRNNRELCSWVPNNCGVGCVNKRLPCLVWTLSARYKSILLGALMEGDGSKGRGDTYRYSTTSAQLADDVQRLAIECGRMSTVSPKIVGEQHSDSYQVNIGRLDRKRITLRKARNVTVGAYAGKVYCLTVPTGAYLVRRNGKPAICGNSAHWRNKADNCITVHRPPDEQKVYICVQKVRHQRTGHWGTAELIYDKVSGRYASPGHAPPFVNLPQAPEPEEDIAVPF